METEEDRLRREEMERTAGAPLPSIAAPLQKTTRNTSGSTSRTVFGPGNEAAEAELQDSYKAAGPLDVAIGQAQASGFDAQADGAARKEQAIAEAETRRAEAEERFAPQLEQRANDYAQRVRTHAETGLKSAWERASNGKKVTAGIAIALGGLSKAFAQAAGQYGGENGALQIITGAIDDDYRAQLTRIEKMKDEIQLSNGRLVDMRAQKQKALDDVDARKAGRLEGVAAYVEKLGAKAGSEEAKAKAERLALGARQEAAKVGLQVQDRHKKEVTSSFQQTSTEADPAYMAGGAAVKLNGPQSDAAGLLGLMTNNLKRIRELQAEGTKFSASELEKLQDNQAKFDAANKSSEGLGGAAGIGLLRAVPLVGNWAAPRDPKQHLTPRQRELLDLQDSNREQMLKALSGAGVTNPELQMSKLKINFSPTDTPEDVERKIAIGHTFVQEQKIKAGAAAPAIQARLESTRQPAPTAAQPTREMKTHPRTGQRVLMERGSDGKWRVVQ